MPLEWQAVADAGILLRPVCGSIPGTLAAGADGAHAERATELSLRLLCTRRGFYRRCVRFIDLHCPQERSPHPEPKPPTQYAVAQT